MKAAFSVTAKTMRKGTSLGLFFFFFLFATLGTKQREAWACWVSCTCTTTEKQRLHCPPSPTSPGIRSLPKFPIGRCCCRSRSSFLRGRVGPEEECLFGVHKSNLCKKQEMGAQKQGTLPANQCTVSGPPIPPSTGGAQPSAADQVSKSLPGGRIMHEPMMGQI